MPDHRTLTDADIAALAKVVKTGHMECNMGLTPDEVSTLKKFLGAFDSASSIIGKLILTAVVAGAIAIFTKGFWVTLITGVKATK